jgi:GntR family transcriptional regulator / MocR family aminotransferase
LADAVRRAKTVADYGNAGHVQAALAAFIAGGDFARYIRRTRLTYERRHHLVMRFLHEHFTGLLQPIESNAGTHVSALLTPGRARDTQLAARALAEGVNVGAISRWGLDRPGPNGFVFGYGGISTDRIADGLAALRRVI